MTIETFVSEAKSKLQSILRESGSVLYSTPETLKHGDYYFLGLNPGGSEEKIKESIEDSLNQLQQGGSESNAYLDEDWSSDKRKYGGIDGREGKHPLQKNAQVLFKELGVDLRDVCASNLIFCRSIGEGGCGYPANAHTCWPVHEMVIDIVKPKVIITFGKKTFDFVCQKLELKESKGRDSGHGNWSCRSASGARTLIGLPHLSRYSLAGKSDVINWIKSKVNSHEMTI